MNYYPIFLDLHNRGVLVVGAGAIGTRKIQGLLKAGARVRVVAVEASAGVQRWSRQGRLEWRRRRYRTSDLDGIEVVFAATDDSSLQQRLAQEARRRRIWINVADVPPLCDFIAPSLVRQGELQIAVSTGGGAPALAKWIRQKLQQGLGPEYGKLARLARQWRPKILKLSERKRASLWKRIASDRFLERIKREGPGPTEARLKEWIHGKRLI